MATELLENTIATLKVLRTSDQGAFLDGQTGAILMMIYCFIKINKLLLWLSEMKSRFFYIEIQKVV